jgi:hypothetical protein
MAADDLYPITVLVDELKDDDVQVKTVSRIHSLFGLFFAPPLFFICCGFFSFFFLLLYSISFSFRFLCRASFAFRFPIISTDFVCSSLLSP